MNQDNTTYDIILVLTDNRGHAKAESAVAQMFAPQQIKVLSSGFEGLDYVSQSDPDLILLDTTLTDMTGLNFLHVLRQNLQRWQMPVVVVSEHMNRDFILDAAKEGCTDYIIRPYDPAEFSERLKGLRETATYRRLKQIEIDKARNLLTNGELDSAINIFKKITTSDDERSAREYYRQGREHLVKKRYNEAIFEFKRALEIYEVFGEAYELMAKAYLGKGQRGEYLKHLKNALVRYAMVENMLKAKTLYHQVKEMDPTFTNPFNDLGIARHIKGHYPEALRHFKHALELTPGDADVHFNISRCYHSIGEEDKAKVHLTHAITIRPDFEEAIAFYEMITGDSPDF